MIDNIGSLENELSKLKDYIAKQEGKKEKLVEQLANNSSKMKEINIEIDKLEKVSIIFQKTSEFAREQSKKQIETLVTKCLQYVFETNIEFVIEIEEMRNKANAEFYVINEVEDTIIKTKPELSRGGGVVDIISLAIRIAFLQIHKPQIQGPLILDEPAKHVSEDYIFNVGDFLRQTSEMFNRQIIMVTHNHHLSNISNNAFRVQLTGFTSSVLPIVDQ